MFETSFVPSGRTHRPLLVAVACVFEASLLGALILIPLLFVEALPERAWYKALMLAPVPTAPPAPVVLVAKQIPRVAPAPRKFNPEGLVSPVVVPKIVAVINEAPSLEIDTATGGVPGGIPGMAGASAGTGFFSNALSVAPPPPPMAAAVAAPPPPAAPKRIFVGGDVQAAMIVQQTQPAYPSLARRGRIHGSVLLKAVIGTDGKIKNLSAASGHPLLVDAALDAVRRWTYRPTILNGVPVEVNTEIVVRFELTS